MATSAGFAVQSKLASAADRADCWAGVSALNAVSLVGRVKPRPLNGSADSLVAVVAGAAEVFAALVLAAVVFAAVVLAAASWPQAWSTGRAR